MTRPEAVRAATVAGWWPWLALPAAVASLVTAGLAISFVGQHGPYVQGEAWFLVGAAVGFSVVAAGIWSTRPHPRGVLRLGVLYTVVALASAVAVPAHAWAGEGLAGAAAVGWLSNWVWALGAPPLMGLGLLLYPDGRLPGRRWWPAAAAGILATAAIVLGGALRPGALEDFPTRNPLGLGSARAWDAVTTAAFPLLLLATAAGVAALVTRFVRAEAGSDLRGQLGGFGLAAGLLAVAAAVPAQTGPAVTVVAITAGVALPATVGHAVLRHRLIDQQTEVAGLRHRVHLLARSRRDQAADRERERADLRRELHDGLGPSLAAIGLGLRRLEGEHDPAAVHALADEVQRAVGEVRRISAGLGPDALESMDLVTALKGSLAALDRFGPAVTLDAQPLPALGRVTEVAAFRIVMEAVTNAVRHAGAARVDVRLWHDDALRLTVTDDGRGVDVAAGGGGTGLAAMRDRAEELGGRCALCSGPGGTTVAAWLPADQL